MPERISIPSNSSTVADDSRLIFYAEGDDAAEYLDVIEEDGEDAVIDLIVGGKLEEIEDEVPEPEDEDDQVFEHDEGYVLVYNRPMERLWLYQLPDSSALL